jgi:hypothetical protein
MIFLKRGFWFAVSVGAVILNLAGAIYAYLGGESMHAFAHGAAAFGFSLLAFNLRPHGPVAMRSVKAPDRTQMLEADLSELERELEETRKKLDFADQLLKNKPPTS